jgi:hypothetical protein
MKFGIKISSLILLLFLSNISNSQNKAKKNESIYGLNPVLYNGKIYSFTPSADIKGSPFLFTNNKTNEFALGQVTIQDSSYKNLLLNYDIYNQKLLIEFTYLGLGKKIIEVSEAWLQNFYINNKKFVVEKSNDNEKKIYQVIGNSEIRFYYYWYNRLEMRSNLDSYTYYFSPPQKKMYLKKIDEILKFTNNKTLLRLFNKEEAEKIKNFLKKKHLKVRKASDEQMLKLITFCNTLYIDA